VFGPAVGIQILMLIFVMAGFTVLLPVDSNDQQDSAVKLMGPGKKLENLGPRDAERLRKIDEDYYERRLQQ